MLLLGDLLQLHVHSEAEKFLKPWWDIVIDYLNLVLVMIAVVCGVVGLYAPGPVCIPVLRCPAHTSSSHKTAICAMIRNSSENGEDSLNITVAVPFSDRNTFDYINSECGDCIFWMVRFFPNVLIVAAGCCVVCSAAWFALKSHVLEEFSYFLKQCYKHAGSENTATESNADNSASTEPSETTTCTIQEPCSSVTFDHEGSAPPSPIEKDRNGVGERLQNFITGFNENDIGNCRCCYACCCSNSCSIVSYIIISIIQVVVSSVTFDTVLKLKKERMNRQYECNINEKTPGLVYDHFACSYSIIQFYDFGAIVFLVFTGLHMFFSWMKLVVSLLMQTRLWLYETDFLNINSPDLNFFLKLVEFSNPAYVKPFCKIRKGSDQPRGKSRGSVP